MSLIDLVSPTEEESFGAIDDDSDVKSLGSVTSATPETDGPSTPQGSSSQSQNGSILKDASMNASMNTSIFSDDDELLRRPSCLSGFARPVIDPDADRSSGHGDKKCAKKAAKKAAQTAKRTAAAEAKAAKKAKKEEEKRRKAREKMLVQESTGKFAAEELCVMLEEALAGTEMGKKLVGALQAKKYMACIDNDTEVPGTIRWRRRPYSLGGATDQVVPGSVEVDTVAVVFWDPSKFLFLLRKDNLAADDHPYLREWVKGVRRAGLRQSECGRMNDFRFHFARRGGLLLAV